MHETTSQAKIDANRINARKSTGPTSEAGKAKVSQNGTTHGLAGRNPLVRQEEREEWCVLYQEMLQSFNPADAAEKQFFDQMFDATWSLRRIAKCEIELYNKSGIDPMISPDPYVHKQHAGLMRYKVDHTRMYNRAYKELTNLQNHRAAQESLQAAKDAAKHFCPDPAKATATATPPDPPTPAQTKETIQSQTIIEAFAEKFCSAIENEISGTQSDLAKVFQSFGNLPKS